MVSSVGQVPLSWLIVVDNGDVGALGHHIHITEVAAVSDVGEEEKVWISTLVQDPEAAATQDLTRRLC